MVKSKSKKPKSEPEIDNKTIIYAIVGLVLAYIIYTNFWTLIIGGSITLIIILIIVILGAYYLLPIIGINLLKGDKK